MSANHLYTVEKFYSKYMKQSTDLLRFLGVAIILFLLWAFQSTQSISEAQRAEERSSELYRKGEYEAGFEKVLEATTLYKKDKNWGKAVECLLAAYRYEDYIPALQGETYLRQAVELSNEYLPKNHKEKGNAYESLGEWYSYNEQYDSSIIALKTAVDIFENVKDWERNAVSLTSLAAGYFHSEDLDNMFVCLDAAHQLAQREQLDSYVFDIIYGYLGTYYYTTLDIEKAIFYNNRSLQLIEYQEEKNEADSFYIANLYNNQGVSYIQHFNLQRAEFCFSKCISIYQSIGVPFIQIIDTYDNYSEVLYQLGQYDKSLAFLEKIKDLKRDDFSKEKYVTTQSSIYRLFIRNYFALSELDSAALYTEKLMKLYGNDADIPPKSLLQKGQLLWHQKNYVAAEKILQSITAKYEAEDADLDAGKRFSKYSNISFIYIVLGKTLYAQGKYKEGLECFQKSLATNISDFDVANINEPSTVQNAFYVQDILTALYHKAITLEAINTKKSKRQALKTYQLAIRWTENTRQNMAFDASKENLNIFSDIYKNAISLAAELYQATDDDQYLDMAFEWSEKEKAVILLENLIGEQGKVATNIPEDLLEREASLKRNLTYFQQKKLELANEKDSKSYQLNEQRFTDANLQLAKLKDTLQTYYKSYFNLEYQSSIATISTVQKDLLQPQQALVQYFTADSLFYVFVIDKENSQLVTLPKGEKESQVLEGLQANLNQSNNDLSDKETFVQFTDLAHRGYQNILAPITSRLSPDVKELIIVPDAALNYLPFEVLLDEAVATEKIDYLNLPYALNDYQFHYGYSGTLLLENQRQYQELKTNDKILAFAPPYKEAATQAIAQRGDMRTLRSNVAQLKGTAKEVKAIAKHFDGEFDFSQSATKANFTKQVPDYGILHLAMHGKPSLDNPSEAHLVFSNLDNETNKDNLLHHYEITALETKAQLAVLSACETGVGKELEGEGVMSLGRGFMYAGIPSVVMSLWKMSDQSTSELMPLFYENLAEGMRKDKALHQAKLEYLDNALPERAHPFYWAGFVSLGDAQPIKKGNSIFSALNIGMGLLGLLLFVLGFWFISGRSKTTN